ncbi:MAG: hypothetical protein ACT4TC_07840 [Myxococcaceae bacterium]
MGHSLSNGRERDVQESGGVPRGAGWLLLPLLLTLQACTVRFISAHDPVLDAQTTELCTRFEAFLYKMETRPSGFAANQDFYDNARAELWTARLRAESTPQSEFLGKHYTLLSDNLELLAKLHQQGGEKGLTPAVIGPAREALRTQFRALTQLHTALRRS